MATAIGKRHEKGRASTQSNHPSSGAGLVRQMQDEVDRWAHRFGVPSPGSWLTQATGGVMGWTPAVDAFQRGNEFVIRADVPGMNRTDLSVEIGDDSVTIRGERKHEAEEERDGQGDLH